MEVLFIEFFFMAADGHATHALLGIPQGQPLPRLRQKNSNLKLN
jgi:hypothetical protein